MKNPSLPELPSFISVILIVQVALYISYFLNIPVARQVLGFAFLTFVPGFVILKLLKQGNLRLVEIVLFSVGISIAFSMIGGLAVNQIGLLIGLSQPLEPILLLLVLSGVVLFALVALYLRNSADLQPFEFSWNMVAKSLLLLLLPILSVIGSYYANVYGNNFLLLLSLLAIIVLFSITVLSGKLHNSKIIFIIVFLISITLLFQYSLASNYIQGFDIKDEYYISTLTQNSGYWNGTASFTELQFGRFSSMLSVTILPVVYSNILHIDISWIFKIFYPLIFALVPIGLYLLWREKFSAEIALMAIFLFISQFTFYTEMLGLARQMIAELFFVLLFLVLFSGKLSSRNVKILFVIFGFCLIASHYSTALIFGFFISLMWLLGSHFSKNPKLSGHLSISLVVAFFTILFLWYTFTSSAAIITSITQDLTFVLSGFNNFFDPSSRGNIVLAGIGATSAPTLLNTASRLVAYLTEFFILIGFLALLVQMRKKDFDYEFFIPCAASFAILFLCILLPNFASMLNITRFYHQLLFFLAPLFVIGFLKVIDLTSKRFTRLSKNKLKTAGTLLMVVLLVSYFAFQTNLVYEVSGSQSWSLPLSKYRMGPTLYTDFEYGTARQVSGAYWLSQNTNISNLLVYADSGAYYNIIAYGGIYENHMERLSNTTSLKQGQFMYLSELNTYYGVIGANKTSDVLASQPLAVIYNSGSNQILTATMYIPPY
jgi:uncharacterized membrane protein